MMYLEYYKKMYIMNFLNEYMKISEIKNTNCLPQDLLYMWHKSSMSSMGLSLQMDPPWAGGKKTNWSAPRRIVETTSNGMDAVRHKSQNFYKLNFLSD